MRLATFTAAAALLAVAAPAIAQDADTASILRSLTPKTHAPGTNADGSVTSDTARGIRVHPPSAATPAAAGTTPAMADKPAVSLLVLFATGSAELTEAGRSQLDKLGAALQTSELSASHFRIEGHTDTTGDAQSNQALSERRAAAVVAYLVGKFGVARTQLVAVGMGKQGLAVATPDQTPEPRNRRVVVVNLDG